MSLLFEEPDRLLGEAGTEPKPELEVAIAPEVMAPSLPHDQMHSAPSFMLAVNIRSPAFEYFMSVTGLVCSRSVASNLSVEGTVWRDDMTESD